MATNNNNMKARIYTQEYRDALETVFGIRRAFDRAFQPLQVLDGIRSNATAFTVKTNNTPVVIKAYDQGANVAFGTGTANSNRFGERTEIIYTDTEVPYSNPMAIHEGIDITTVNNDLEAAVIDRLYAQSEAQTRDMNKRHGIFISGAAGNEEALADYSNDAVLALFNVLSKYQTNKEIAVDSVAYVVPDLYNAIVDHPMASTGKGSSVNIDQNNILYFKGFEIQETPDANFAEGEIAYIVPNGALIPFVGIEIARTIESEAFAGLALQALAKGGAFVLDDNKVAITKVTMVAG